RALGDAVALPDRDLREALVQPGPAAVRGAVDEQRDLVAAVAAAAAEVERLADEVRGAIGAEGNARIAPGVVDAVAGYVRVVRERRYPGQEAVRQRWRPGLAAVEAGVHAAAVVVVPIVRAGQQVGRIRGID